MKSQIAILGTRGIPAQYGGFETFAEELSQRLIKKKYSVTVYCRKGMTFEAGEEWKGVRRVVLPTLEHKYLDTLFHTFLSTLHVCFTRNEIVYYCNAINALFLWIPRMFGKVTVINVDGLEWKRAKWNRLGKLAYQISEWVATKLAHHIISDSKGIQAYYLERYQTPTHFIAYGANKKDCASSLQIIEKWGLKDRRYFLYVSRLEPENNAHQFIEAFEKVDTEFPLVIVGSAPYGRPYMEKLKATKDPRIRFLGALYGEDYPALQSHAYAYFHGNEVGGTNPALLEAMAYGNCVIANGVSFNREVVGDAGICFEPGRIQDLAGKIRFVLENPFQVQEIRQKASQRAATHYSWEGIAEAYDLFFDGIFTPVR